MSSTELFLQYAQYKNWCGKRGFKPVDYVIFLTAYYDTPSIKVYVS